MPLINCEVFFNWICSENCVIYDFSEQVSTGDGNVVNFETGAIQDNNTIQDCKKTWYCNNKIFLTQLFGTDVNMQSKNQNLKYLKSESHLPRNLYYLLDWKPFRNDQKCFLFLYFILKAISS